MQDPRAAKQQLRGELRTILAELTPARAAELSQLVAARIEADNMYTAASVVLAFVPMTARPEVDLRPLLQRAIAAGKRVALPRVDWPNRSMAAHAVTDLSRDLEPDPGPVGGRTNAGLLHPRATCPMIDAGAIDLLLVPGLGFDLTGGRIGHGAGFYDRFLAQPGIRGVVCGVGFETQVLPAGKLVPREPHDRLLDALVTESRLLQLANRGRAGPVGPVGPG